MAETVAASTLNERLSMVLNGVTRWLNLRLARGGWVRVRHASMTPDVLAGLELGDLRRAERHALAVYDADYAAIRDPALTEVLGRLNGEAATFRRQDVIADEMWYGSDFAERIARPSGLNEAMYSAVPMSEVGPDGGRDYFALTLARAWGEPAFQPEERDALAMLHSQVMPIFRAWTHEQTGRQALSELPPRLRQTLACLLDGDSEKAAAERLGLSPHTVHQYVKRLHQTLRVRSRGELLAQCRTLGVMPDVLREMKGEIRRLPA